MGQGLGWFKKDKLLNHFWIHSLPGLRWYTDYKTTGCPKILYPLVHDIISPNGNELRN